MTESNYRTLVETSLADLARCAVENANECYSSCTSRQALSGTPTVSSTTLVDNNDNSDSSSMALMSCDGLDILLTRHNDQLACCRQCLVHFHNTGEFLVSVVWKNNMLDCYENDDKTMHGAVKLRQSPGYIWNQCEDSIDSLFGDYSPSVLDLQESLDCIHRSFGSLLERTAMLGRRGKDDVHGSRSGQGARAVPAIAGGAMVCFLLASLVSYCARAARRKDKRVYPTDEDEGDGAEQIEDSFHRPPAHVVPPEP